MKNKIKIGELLMAAGLLDESQLQQATRFQSEMGGTLGCALTQLGFITTTSLLDVLSEQMGLDNINLEGIEITVPVQKLVKWETVRQRKVLPIRQEGNTLLLGMVDPTDFNALTEVEFQSGHSVKPLILSSNHFKLALAFFEAQGYGSGTLELDRESASRRLVPEESGITGFLKALVEWRGQDLHLSAGSVPSIRVDNEMLRLQMPPLTPSRIEEMIYSILTPEQRKTFEEDLELDFAYALGEVGRFRCNAYRQRRSLTFTARHVSERIPGAAELGLPGFLRDFALKTQGLILITGPNGHGKSTTLAWMVDVINRERKANIITIEDPIEFTHRHKKSNVNQREVGTDTHSFAAGLRHIFRQNPDVIVIGELRDYESFAIAVTAAQTGHLVLGTLHSSNATAAVDRIIDVFPAEQQQQIRAQLADTLLLVFSQRLLALAAGKGRIMAWEMMASSVRVRNHIREGKVHQLRGLMQTNMEELVSLDQNLADLVAAGKVKSEEAIKYADNVSYYQELLKVRKGGHNESVAPPPHAAR